MSNWTDPVHGTDGDGNDVTASFGTGPREGESMLADGHKDTADFWGTNDNKGHDHYGSGNGPNDNGTERGQYTGNGS